MVRSDDIIGVPMFHISSVHDIKLQKLHVTNYIYFSNKLFLISMHVIKNKSTSIDTTHAIYRARGCVCSQQQNAKAKYEGPSYRRDA